MRLATILLAGAFALSLALPAFAADDSKVKAATRQVEHSAELRRHNEQTEQRQLSRVPGFRRRTDSDPSAS